MCRNHRHPTANHKQHRQNEPAGQVDVPIKVGVCVTGDPGYVYGPQTSHCKSKTTQTE